MRCGWVARPDLFEGEAQACLDCGRPLVELDLAHARQLVASRRRADERRLERRASAELDLNRIEREWPEAGAGTPEMDAGT